MSAAFRKYASDFRFIHIASHGDFDPERPLDSSVILAPQGTDDGRLTVSDLYAMRIGADLVTLSGCETGLGRIANGDDVVGLTRGFLYAGTRTIVASLWQVEDRATGDLMIAFYWALAQGSPSATRSAPRRSSNSEKSRILSIGQLSAHRQPLRYSLRLSELAAGHRLVLQAGTAARAMPSHVASIPSSPWPSGHWPTGHLPSWMDLACS